MRFTPCPREADNPYNVQSWRSETGKYLLQFNRVLFGYRVQLVTPMPDWELVADYCAGASVEWMETIHLLMQRILLPIPESTGRYELARIWPGHRVRPMARDAQCQRELVALAVGEGKLDLRDLAQATLDMEAHLEVEASVSEVLNSAQQPVTN